MCCHKSNQVSIFVDSTRLKATLRHRLPVPRHTLDAIPRNVDSDKTSIALVLGAVYVKNTQKSVHSRAAAPNYW
jgi:hypothetical protein